MANTPRHGVTWASATRVGKMPLSPAVKPYPRQSLIQFAENLRHHRLRRALTQEKMSEVLEITPRHYQKLEAGTVTPAFGTLVRIKNALRVSWNQLMDGV